jgi:hypothetical protein
MFWPNFIKWGTVGVVFPTYSAIYIINNNNNNNNKLNSNASNTHKIISALIVLWKGIRLTPSS